MRYMDHMPHLKDSPGKLSMLSMAPLAAGGLLRGLPGSLGPLLPRSCHTAVTQLPELEAGHRAESIAVPPCTKHPGGEGVGVCFRLANFFFGRSPPPGAKPLASSD